MILYYNNRRFAELQTYLSTPMTDVFTNKKRSEIMSKIRSENTEIERLIFRELCRRGIYFQRHYKKAQGKPDIALPKKKKALFIGGDFWHGRNFSKQKKRLPKKYWLSKIENNIKNDRRNRLVLKKHGWKVMRIWENQLEKDFPGSMKKIIKFLE